MLRLCAFCHAIIVLVAVLLVPSDYTRAVSQSQSYDNTDDEYERSDSDEIELKNFSNKPITTENSMDQEG